MKKMSDKTKKIINWVLLGILFAAILVTIICAFAVKPRHTCLVDGKEHAMEYEFQIGTEKLNGRTYKRFGKVHLCKEDLAKVKAGTIKLTYDKDTKVISYSVVEK